MAMSKDHPLASRDSVRLIELESENWVTLPAEPGSILRESLLTASKNAVPGSHRADGTGFDVVDRAGVRGNRMLVDHFLGGPEHRES